jgi:hypothetical protein
VWTAPFVFLVRDQSEPVPSRKMSANGKRWGKLLGMTLGAWLTLTAAERRAFAGDDREVCANAAEQAQQLRDEGKYRRAREQMLVCARESCPGAVRSDCGKWLTELDRDAPTVVFGARDSRGSDIVDVKVSMDGVAILDRLDGKPVLVDSGEHTFKFESKDGVREEKVLLRAAEKARPIIASFSAAGGGPTPPPTSGGGHPDKAEKTEAPSIIPIAVVGGIGVVALASFAIFGISGKSDVDDLQSCKPNCKQKDVDSARTKLIIADISLGVGVVAVGVAAVLYFTRPKMEAKVQTARGDGASTWGLSNLRANAVPGGAVAGVGGSF